MTARDDAAFLRLQGIGKTFGNGVTALAGLDLGIDRGEFVSLLGPSGCGKSTVLQIIAGLEKPSAGQLTGGAPGKMGYVFQEPNLLPWKRIRDNVALPLKFAGAPAAQRQTRVDEVLDLVGLVEFADAYPRELSGGMRMRASIARALTTRPEVLLMDEPFGALDEPARQRLNREIYQLWQEQQQTVIFVTHSVSEAAYLSGRICVMSMRPGRILGECRPAGRDGTDYRYSAGYNEACREAGRLLDQAVEGSPL